jgi:hypothetical protein
MNRTFSKPKQSDYCAPSQPLYLNNRRPVTTIWLILGVTGHCGGTPHSCGSEPAQFNILPDKSGVPAETMRWIFCSIKGRPLVLSRLSRKIIRPFAQTDNAQFRNAIPPAPAWPG